MKSLVNLLDIIPGGKGRLGDVGHFEAMKRGQVAGLKSLKLLKNIAPGSKWLIVGGGAGILDYITEIKRRRLRDPFLRLMTINKTHDMLLQHGIKSDACVLLEPARHVVDYVSTPVDDCAYLIGSIVHPDVLEKFRNTGYVWHPHGYAFDFKDMIMTFGRREMIFVSGPSTAGLRAPYLAYFLGGRAFEWLAIDGSYRVSQEGDKLKPISHPYPKPFISDITGLFNVIGVDGTKRTFYANQEVARQCWEVPQMLETWKKARETGEMEPVNLTINGPLDCAIPYWAAKCGIHASDDFNREHARAPEYSQYLGDHAAVKEIAFVKGFGQPEAKAA
jgi:hypothetical protein